MSPIALNDPPTMEPRVRKTYHGARILDLGSHIEISLDHTKPIPKDLLEALWARHWKLNHDTNNHRRVATAAVYFEAQAVLKEHLGEPIP